MKFIAFWNYSTFPYCLWGELESATKTGFTVKGFDGMNFSMEKSKIAFLPEEAAQEVIEKLENLMCDRSKYLNKLNDEVKDIINGL